MKQLCYVTIIILLTLKLIENVVELVAPGHAQSIKEFSGSNGRNISVVK